KECASQTVRRRILIDIAAIRLHVYFGSNRMIDCEQSELVKVGQFMLKFSNAQNIFAVVLPQRLQQPIIVCNIDAGILWIFTLRQDVIIFPKFSAIPCIYERTRWWWW